MTSGCIGLDVRVFGRSDCYKRLGAFNIGSCDAPSFTAEKTEVLSR